MLVVVVVGGGVGGGRTGRRPSPACERDGDGSYDEWRRRTEETGDIPEASSQ
jgi:hypothetical protein